MNKNESEILKVLETGKYTLDQLDAMFPRFKRPTIQAYIKSLKRKYKAVKIPNLSDMRAPFWSAMNLEDFIYRFLEQSGEQTRGEMSQKILIPRTTLYDNLILLEEQGRVERIEKDNGKGSGRKLVFWRIVIE